MKYGLLCWSHGFPSCVFVMLENNIIWSSRCNPGDIVLGVFYTRKCLSRYMSAFELATIPQRNPSRDLTVIRG